jgi:hypothetical protein
MYNARAKYNGSWLVNVSIPLDYSTVNKYSESSFRHTGGNMIECQYRTEMSTSLPGLKDYNLLWYGYKGPGYKPFRYRTIPVWQSSVENTKNYGGTLRWFIILGYLLYLRSFLAWYTLNTNSRFRGEVCGYGEIPV